MHWPTDQDHELEPRTHVYVAELILHKMKDLRVR